MLSLEKPPLRAGGLTVFADHADDVQYYYAAPNPRLAATNGRAMFDVFGYAVQLKNSPLAGTRIPDQLGAGFLTMGVECVLADAQLARVREELATQLGVADSATLRLSPIPYTAGKVSVIALDAATGSAAQPTTPTPPAGRPRFVEAVVGTGVPSLLGDLRSIFSLSLSQDGLTFLEGLYTDGAAPVGVVYELTFYGLRPAVEARIHADVGRIYNEFGGNLSAGCGYFRADIDATLSRLEQTGAVQIELTSQAVGPEAEAAKERALALFKDRIVQELFQPSTPIPPNLGSVFGMPGGGQGQKQSAIVSLSLRFKHSEELKTVDYDFSERSPEARTHAPQAFIDSFLDAASLAEHIHHVDLDSDFFELLQVLVTAPSSEEFAALGLRQATVDLAYGTGPQAATGTLLFRPGGATELTWAARRDGRPSLEYAAAVTYEFDASAGVDADALTYRLPARPHTGRVLSIRPYDDVGVLDVEVELGRQDADVVAVDVVCEYPARLSSDGGGASEPAGFSARQEFRLDPADPAPVARRRWQVRTGAATASAYTATATFAFADGSALALPSTNHTEPLLRIASPFHGRRTLLIQPNVTSADVAAITVEVRYTDGAYARRLASTLTPRPDVPVGPAAWAPVTLSWPVLDPGVQGIEYRVTTVAGGLSEASDWAPTSDPSIVVGAVGQRQRHVEVRLIGPALPEAGLDALQVRVGVGDHAETDAVSAFFDPTTPRSQSLTVPANPGDPAGFRFQTTAFRTDGTAPVSLWQPAANALIVVSTRTG